MKFSDDLYELFMRRVALCAAFLLFVISPAFADDVDPFQMDTMQWMSFDRYKDNIKHGKTYEPAPVAKPETSSPSDAHFLNGSPTDSGAPVIAAPQRPLNTPPLPGINKGFDVQVNSTEDNKPPVAQITHIDSEPKVQLKQNWQTTKEALHNLQTKKPGSDDEDEDNNPLDVRMSFLPSSGVTPIPDPATPHSTQGRPPAAIAAASSQKPQDANNAEYAKWSAELDAYKKRKLEALQSDRETLKALQDAIRQLGLQKQLDFMPGSNTNLGVQADGAAASPNMDVPAPSITNLSKTKN